MKQTVMFKTDQIIVEAMRNDDHKPTFRRLRELESGEYSWGSWSTKEEMVKNLLVEKDGLSDIISMVKGFK